MQFIDFKKEHFTLNEKSQVYFLEILKDEVGYGRITVQKKENNGTYSNFHYNLLDDLLKVTIVLTEPYDIRVYF